MDSEVVAREKISVINEEGTEIDFTFELSTAGDVVKMLTRAANPKADGVTGRIREIDPHLAQVLMAQATMIKKALHVEELDYPHLMGGITAFHEKFGLAYDGKPRMLEPELYSFRKGFIQEEFDEWQREQDKLVAALTSDDGQPDHRAISAYLNKQLDALVDLTYVVLGTAYLQFGPKLFDLAWARVQEANMAKVRCERVEDSTRGSTFDVVKPEGWVPPDHYDLVKDHAHMPRRAAAVTGDARSDTQVVRDQGGSDFMGTNQ